MTEKLPPTWPMYRALVGIGMLCGLVIALVFQGTLPVIERNRAEALEKAIFAVLPAATERTTFDVDGERVHAGYDDSGALVGIAIEAAGMGYADTISILYGYSPGDQTIVGMQVLASKETPGLGDKIETDPGFRENFVALDVRLDASGTQLVNAVETVKQGAKTEAWQLDGITGATISSQAIGDILAGSTARWLPVLQSELETFAGGGGDGES